MIWTSEVLSIVFSRVKDIVGRKISGINWTTTARAPTKPKFPTVYIHKLEGSEAMRDLNGNTVNAIISNIQVDVIGNDGQNQVNEIAYEIQDAMKSMRYNIVGDVFIDESDTETYRSVARYRRTIGHGDTL